MSERNGNTPTDPLEATPPREASPVAIALHEARELFVQKWRDSMPRTRDGSLMLDLMQMALTVKLDEMRITALANVLVQKGLVTADELCIESTKLLTAQIEAFSQLIVARELGMNGKRVA